MSEFQSWERRRNAAEYNKDVGGLKHVRNPAALEPSKLSLAMRHIGIL